MRAAHIWHQWARMWWYWRECDIGENVMILARMWWIRLVFWTKIATVGDILGVAQWNFEKLGIKNINKIKKYHFLKNRYFSLLFFDFPFWRNPNFGDFYWFSIDFLLVFYWKIKYKSPKSVISKNLSSLLLQSGRLYSLIRLVDSVQVT